MPLLIWVQALLGCVPDFYCTASDVTAKFTKDDGPKLVEIATSVASRPVAISTRPIRGTL